MISSVRVVIKDSGMPVWEWLERPDLLKAVAGTMRQRVTPGILMDPDG